jgi:hypothetical protein
MHRCEGIIKMIFREMVCKHVNWIHLSKVVVVLVAVVAGVCEVLLLVL